ncbi:receptor-type tyrosine-protein phosphatase beta-like [Panulirus ornatus]|uniref:receptor-type tyrosine-protein phosphatase beta-like n=1 Tax=Panulirus ornatus TaxID=150431 RepID=UPI003A854A61
MATPQAPQRPPTEVSSGIQSDEETSEKCEISGDTCPIDKRTQCNCSLLHCSIELKPETEYRFRLYAENCEPEGLSKPAVRKLTTTAGIPFFADKPLLRSDVENDKPDKTFPIIIDPRTFRHDNGRIRKYEIHVRKDCIKPEEGKPTSLPVFFSQDIPDHKIAFVIGENRPPCTNISCNFELTPVTKYCFFVRIYTSRSSKDSAFERFETKESPLTTLALVTLALVSVLVVAVVVVLILVAYSRFFSFMKRSISIDLPLVVALPTDVDVERRILVHDLPTCVPKLLSQNKMDLKQEFSLLQAACPIKPCRYASAPANSPKNRYINILPFDETRVRMKEYRYIPFSDYINASYIHGYDKKRQFIACQGPTELYIDDFWRMVWEKNVHVIAMVTQCVEKNKNKCCKYWPDRKEPSELHLKLSRLKVQTMYESAPHPAGYITRRFKLSKGKKSRIILHFHYVSWPDMGCPQSTDDLIQFALAVKNAVPQESSHTVVHCSAGVGRTGTLIGLSNLIDEMEVKESVDVFHAVYRMRLHRCNMVQTMDQYAFLYQCVLHYYLKMTGQSEAKSIEEKENQPVRGNGPDVILSTPSPIDLCKTQNSSSSEIWNNGILSSPSQSFEWTDEEYIDYSDFEANEMSLIKHSNDT